jgi:hypothetical protein
MRADIRPITVFLGAQLLAGVIGGFLWLAWAGRSSAYLVQGPDGKPIVLPMESEDLIAADGRYLVIVMVTGAIAGAAAWFALPRLRGPIALGVVTVGSIVGAWLTKIVAEALAPGSFHGALNTVIAPPLRLQASPMMLSGAFAAVLVYVIFAGFTDDADFTQPRSTRQPRPELGPTDPPVSSSRG